MNQMSVFDGNTQVELESEMQVEMENMISEEIEMEDEIQIVMENIGFVESLREEAESKHQFMDMALEFGKERNTLKDALSKVSVAASFAGIFHPSEYKRSLDYIYETAQKALNSLQQKG